MGLYVYTVYRRDRGGGGGEGVVSESLLSYKLRYVSLTELDNVFQVGFREPMHLCTCVSEEGGDGHPPTQCAVVGGCVTAMDRSEVWKTLINYVNLKRSVFHFLSVVNMYFINTTNIANRQASLAVSDIGAQDWRAE